MMMKKWCEWSHLALVNLNGLGEVANIHHKPKKDHWCFCGDDDNDDNEILTSICFESWAPFGGRSLSFCCCKAGDKMRWKSSQWSSSYHSSSSSSLMTSSSCSSSWSWSFSSSSLLWRWSWSLSYVWWRSPVWWKIFDAKPFDDDDPCNACNDDGEGYAADSY